MDLLGHGRVEPGELLEESWFFGNWLHGKSRMFIRRHSDPCPTSNSIQDMNLLVAADKSMEETYSSIIKKIPSEGRTSSLTRAGAGLMKTTSMPPNVKNSKESSTTNQQMQCGGHLLRAPSLPTFAEKEEFQDEESEFSMGKLIRQASLNHAIRVQPPPLPSVKGLTRSCSIISTVVPKHTISKITGRDCDEIKQRKVTGNQALARKSVYDNRTEELQRLNKTLSLKFQERRRIGSRDEENVLRRRNSSELGWVAKSCGTPPTPFQNAKKSPQDMKAQIKFWARAVASNVRQEC